MKNRAPCCASWECRPSWAPIRRGHSSPRPPSMASKVLRKAGWDGSTPVLVVCPINPFEWPVKASVAKFAAAQPDRRIQRQPLPLGVFP